MSNFLLRTCPTCNRRQRVFFGTDGNGNVVETSLGCGHPLPRGTEDEAPPEPPRQLKRKRCKDCGERRAFGRQSFCATCKTIRQKAAHKRWEERRRSA